MKILNAYYDLRIAPLSYDFINYLAIACAEAEKTDSKLSVTLFHPFFRNTNAIENSFASGYHMWKLNNVHIRIAHLCPRVTEVVSNWSDRIRFDAPHYPYDYHPQKVDLTSGVTPLPHNHHVLDAAMAGIKDKIIYRHSNYAAHWYKGRFGEEPLVVMSMRITPHNPGRNTPLDKWYELYRSVVSAGFRCVVIPDQDDFLGAQTYRAYDWPVAAEACMDLDLRLALYQRAFAVLAWTGGVEGLLALSGCTFTFFAIWQEGNVVSSQDFFRRKGPTFGQQPDWFDKLRQRYDWHPGEHVTAAYLIERTLPWLEELKKYGAKVPGAV